MQSDLIGRINNTRLPSNQALLPVFEAIVNSINACNDLEEGDRAAISVRLLRDDSQCIIAGSSQLHPVTSFEIVDTGIGFTDDNYKSFATADSRYRAAIGGKGIGRFLWLVAFDHAEVESTYPAGDGKWMHRSFKLKLTTDGIEEHVLDAAKEQKRQTIVRLIGVKPKFEKSLPKSAPVIANRIVEHCLQYFLLGMSYTVTVVDDENQERISLDDIVKEQVESQGASVPLEVSGRAFELHHLRVRPTYGDGHRLYFCADKRVVTSEKLLGRIPNLESSVKDSEGKTFVYSGYVSGEFLDENVNSERTEFVMPDDNTAFGDPTWNDLFAHASVQAQKFLEPFTATIKKAKEERIKEFVRTKSPTFRPLVKHRPEIIDLIPSNLSDDRLDQELYRYNQDYERCLREKGDQLVASIQEGDETAVRATDEEFLKEWNESGIAKLANHVVYRKATLKLLRASLSLNSSAKYSLEEAVHKLICPLRKSSDDIPAEQMNLWIIDEKLAYHFHLASDVPFKALKEDILDLNSQDRADLLVFNNATAFVQEESPFSSVVIVEFKRPARNDYTDDENPINQIYRYVQQIRGGKAVDRRGRPIMVGDSVPFYAYIVADVTRTLRDQATMAGFQPNHDGSGFFTFNQQFRTYVELISFDNLVLSAERRNQYFFNQLNLPS